jgi:ribonuclease III
MTHERDFSAFEKKAGLEFKDKELLRQAFIHRSYINENKGSIIADNERLEFLGDAVLELVSTDYLFRKYTDKPEGELTAYRSALVNAVTLAKVATDIGMNDFLFLSHGESRDTGRARQYILADAIEALIGAIYLDRGYDAAKEFIEKNVLYLIEDVVSNKTWLDAKSYFQEAAQERAGITPLYKTIRESGPDHDKQFTVGVFLGGEMIGSGEGKSKQEAEQDAARKALEEKGWL